jgi:tRNA (guanine37-N1)-methyltransferase
MIGYDLVGDIAIIKFDRNETNSNKLKFAQEFLNKNKNIKTILEKTNKIKGILRIHKTRFLLGENKRETTHKENYCLFKLDVDKTYFSPRLANERKVIAQEILKKISHKKDKILVMFAGVAPFPIVIGKVLKQAGKKAEIISNEINRNACKYAEENVKLNKLQDYIKIIQCDAKKLPEKLKKRNMPEKFDFIMMARPNLKDTFLETAVKLAKKGAIIYYHGFGTKEKVLDELKNELKKLKVKTSRIKIRKAGDIAPKESRWNYKFEVK